MRGSEEDGKKEDGEEGVGDVVDLGAGGCGKVARERGRGRRVVSG